MEQKQKSQNQKINKPDVSKPYVFRNFFKEMKRVSWPTKKKNWVYFLLTFLFIIVLVIFFALISFGASKIIELIGAK